MNKNETLSLGLTWSFLTGRHTSIVLVYHHRFGDENFLKQIQSYESRLSATAVSPMHAQSSEEQRKVGLKEKTDSVKQASEPHYARHEEGAKK